MPKPQTSGKVETTPEELVGEGFWYPCTGCYEIGDYGSGAENYPYDEGKKCRLGAGCHECRGVGALFEPLSEEDLRKLTQT